MQGQASQRETLGQKAIKQKLRHRSLSTSRANSSSSESWHTLDNINPSISFKKSLAKEDRVTLNIGGQKFQTQRRTLLNIEGTVLYDLANSTRYQEVNGLSYEYFFDRNSAFFNHILDYYRDGELHFDHSLCPFIIKKELKFWRISEDALSNCCWLRYKQFFDLEDNRSSLGQVFSNDLNVQDSHMVIKSNGSNPKEEEVSLSALSFKEYLITTYHKLRAMISGENLSRFNLLRLSFWACFYELHMFTLILTIASIIFAFMIYVIEPREIIPNLSVGIWWAFLTMTTVGYGEALPMSIFGYVIGITCSVFGISILAAVLPIIADKYAKFLTQFDELKKLKDRNRKQIKEES